MSAIKEHNHNLIDDNMKKIFLLSLPVLFLFSCKKGDKLPHVETIISGSKWTLQIGSSPADVYGQLQKLGEEKKFNDVAVVYRQPFSKPEEIKDLLEFYQAITLQKSTGQIERVLIQFKQDKVSSMEAGGGMLNEVSKWPQDAPGEITIHNNDSIDALYTKLLAIYQMPTYNNYQIILPDKPLEKPFDPDMANYSEWHFTFSIDVKAGKTGTSAVTLYFKNGKLNKIQNTYNEADVYN